MDKATDRHIEQKGMCPSVGFFLAMHHFSSLGVSFDMYAIQACLYSPFNITKMCCFVLTHIKTAQ